ncbi:MAG: hypothetical protein ABIP89_12725 [Polyangiaceae bacterium]
MTRLGERAGIVLGWAIGPVFAGISFARHARTFHPTGETFLANVEPFQVGARLGEILRGPALVRFSGALWKDERPRPDVLGCAIRFRRTWAHSPDPLPGDQDLLFATIRHPWTMPLAPFFTNARDFQGNDYFAVSPFDAPGFERCYFRLRPNRPPRNGYRLHEEGRIERLRSAIAAGEALFRLDVRREGETRWFPLAVIDVREHAFVDQERLRFSPFRTGRDIVPRGFIHALRRGVYALSQLARPEDSAAQAHLKGELSSGPGGRGSRPARSAKQRARTTSV